MPEGVSLSPRPNTHLLRRGIHSSNMYFENKNISGDNMLLFNKIGRAAFYNNNNKIPVVNILLQNK